MRRPKTHYTNVGDAQVAYQVFGDGPIDLVLFQGLAGSVEYQWELPPVTRCFERLASFSRVIVFDRRGTGISDGIRVENLPTWEHWAEDLTAVLDAASSERAAIFATVDASPWGMLFAATNPDRVAALILWNSFAKSIAAEDYDIGLAPEVGEAMSETMERMWGTPEFAELVDPQRGEDVERFARLQRFGCTPAAAAAQARFISEIDARPVLSSIQSPTLVIHNDNSILPIAIGRYVAEHITGARFAHVPGTGMTVWSVGEEMDAILDVVEEFVTGTKPPARIDRVLATIMFTDVVGSTQRAADAGDHQWRELLDKHDRLARSIVESAAGRIVKTTGDGLLATFDGPGRAIRCAAELQDSLAGIGLEIYAGLHTGEIEVRGDADIGGIAVHIAARVMDEARAGEILCSRTVKDLVAGSGIEFEHRGTHALKGVPDEWELFSARMS